MRWAALLLLTAGCSSTLETGYKFRPLTSSEDERRAFYAPAYTPESHPDRDKANGPTLEAGH